MMMYWILGATMVGWMLQLFTAYRQSNAFNATVRELRTSGTVSVGSAGRRYRGGRAFVALAVDQHGIVRDALSLSGWTTFARGKPVPALTGAKVHQVKGRSDFPSLTTQQREAAREAATLMGEKWRSPMS